MTHGAQRGRAERAEPRTPARGAAPEQAAHGQADSDKRQQTLTGGGVQGGGHRADQQAPPRGGTQVAADSMAQHASAHRATQDKADGADRQALAVVRERMLAASWQTPADAAPGTAASTPADMFLHGLRADGTWADIDYRGMSTTQWEPAEHLRRLEALAHAWAAPDSQRRGDAALLDGSRRALDAWLRLDPRRPWWWDAIGAPRLLSAALLLLDGTLTQGQLDAGLQILQRAQLGATGQNLVWQAEITARRAVLQRDAALLRQAFALIAAEVKTSRREGIQPDYSFHQHGAVLYNHGYGAGFATDNARLAGLVAGTPCAYPAPTLQLLSAYILDGSQWLARGRHPDFGAVGREITRPGKDAAYLAAAAQDMLRLPTGRQEEFAALLARVTGAPAPPLVGTKHFYCSDTMVHHRPGWYMSARMHSTRTYNTDGLSGCDEGYLSHYLADGATCLLRHGGEYSGIFPVWDWQRIPGTTVELAPHVPGEPKRQGTTDFAGGVTDGQCGVAGFALERSALTARKAWFFFSDAACCLGSGIRCGTGHPVVTTVDQCRQAGPAAFGGTPGGMQESGQLEERLSWVHHDGVAYVFPVPTRVHLSCRRQEGSWQRISGQRSAAPVEARVFCLDIPHGEGPADAAYAYGVLPGVAAQDVPQLVRELPFAVHANSAALQAVEHAGDQALGVICYGAGDWPVGPWRLRVSRGCALLMRATATETTVWAADPVGGGDTLVVELVTPEGRGLAHDFALPSGDLAGAAAVWRFPSD